MRARDVSPGSWRTRQLLVAMSALGVLIAGCASAKAPSQVAVQRRPVQPGGHGHELGPRGGSPAIARAEARRILARLVLPPGSKRVAARRLPPRVEGIGSDSVVDLHRFFSIPMPMSAAGAFVTRHTPTGFEPYGRHLGTSGNYRFINFYLRSAPMGITDDTMLVVTFGPGPHGSTVVRADAEVVWYPSRTAAEYLRADAFGSAAIRASFLNPKPRHFEKVITSRHAIGRLAALLNGLRATDNSSGYCPAIDATYSVTFIGRAGHPKVAVGAFGCGDDAVFVNGKEQPNLSDPGELIKALHKLLGLSKRYH